MENNKNYYVGLDIGTDSVGYAVTDKEYNLLKFKGEPMWGVTLFDEASLNDQRRGFRSARRRLDRKQQRISLLQELFAKEIAKIDERFFIRLKSSYLIRDEVSDDSILFNDEIFKDKDYYKKYKTIHHLIMDLIYDDSEKDIRLVYLACAWLVSHRGHFLNEIDVNQIEKINDFEEIYLNLINSIRNMDDDVVFPWDVEKNVDEIKTILKSDNSVSVKYKKLAVLLFENGKVPKENNDFPVNAEILLKLLCGSTVKAEILFANEEYNEIESFSLGDDDEKLAKIMGQLGENANLIESAKAVFDCALLDNSLAGCTYISEAKVNIYKQHKEDLKNLKYIIKKYCSSKYNEIFRNAGKNNYVAYSYHYENKIKNQIEKKANKEDFSKYLLEIIEKIVPEERDSKIYNDIKERLNKRTFLPKQKDTDNRVIPHQLFQVELNKILENAEKYLPFLSEKDIDGISVSEKIKSIFVFRVPYYVGPLNRHSENSWVEFKCKEHGRILPWNFNDIVDEDKSEEAFIKKMTNKCTYLPDKDVLPKDSLLYHRFTVLNEINNLKINGENITVEIKQKIYDDVFMKCRKVTVKKIKDYLICNNYMSKDAILSGVDETIKSDLKPYHDFKNLMDKKILSEEDVENIIEHRSYSEDKARFTKWIKKYYPNLCEADINYVSSLKFKDFGRLSREFLTELEGTCKKDGTGELYTVMRMMWETNKNLNEILSDKYTFRDEIEKKQYDYYSTKERNINNRLDEMYLSNSVKRPVIRAMEIVKEVVKARGYAPQKIFVEMTRGSKPDEKGKRTKSRKDQILELYKNISCEDVRALEKELEALGDSADNMLQSEVLYLYFTQLGKCLYTGERIDINKLKDGTYNRDHIYPQAYVKDDSIINNKVLVKSLDNGEKSDRYPIAPEIRKNMYGFWSMLHENKLMSDEKFKRLIRKTPFSEDEKIGFINRQLTETSQSTKAVASLLKEYYPETEIVYVKAQITSEFRHAFQMEKSRVYNDLHHAKDAYLNIITGNVYDMKFSKKWFDINKDYSIKTKTIFSNPLICNGETVWKGNEIIDKIKKTVEKNNAHITKYAYCRKGGFFDQQPVKAAENLAPRKAGLSTEKYGGYRKIVISSFIIIKYPVKKNKNEIMFFPVELLYEDKFYSDENFAKEYIEKFLPEIKKDDITFPLGFRKIKIDTRLRIDGFDMTLSSGSFKDGRMKVSPLVPFSSSYEVEAYLKKVEKLVEKVSNAQKERRTYLFDEKYDGVSSEKNIELYDIYISKLEKGIFSKRILSKEIKEILVKRKDVFIKLSCIQQAEVLINIHDLFNRNCDGINLKLLNESANSLQTRKKIKLSGWVKTIKDIRIVDTSASGLWEKTSVNLLDLL